MYCTAYNLWTFTWFVHFELPFRLKGTDKIHTEGFSKFLSNIFSILFGITTGMFLIWVKKSQLKRLTPIKKNIISRQIWVPMHILSILFTSLGIVHCLIIPCLDQAFSYKNYFERLRSYPWLYWVTQ